MGTHLGVLDPPSGWDRWDGTDGRKTLGWGAGGPRAGGCSGDREGLVLLSAATMPIARTRFRQDRAKEGPRQAVARREVSAPTPQLHRLPHSSPGQPPAVPKGRMRHFSCCHTQRRGADGKALRTGCCRSSVGVLASLSPRAASVHASVRAGWRCHWHMPGTPRRWRLVVMAQVAVLCPVPWAAHGAEHSGDPGSTGTGGLLGGHVPSLALLRSPGGCPGRGTARGHRGGAHMLSASW